VPTELSSENIYSPVLIEKKILMLLFFYINMVTFDIGCFID